MIRFRKVYLVEETWGSFQGTKSKFHELTSLKDVLRFVKSGFNYGPDCFEKYRFIKTVFIELPQIHEKHGRVLGAYGYKQVIQERKELGFSFQDSKYPHRYKDEDIKDILSSNPEEEYLFDNGEDLF